MISEKDVEEDEDSEVELSDLEDSGSFISPA